MAGLMAWRVNVAIASSTTSAVGRLTAPSTSSTGWYEHPYFQRERQAQQQRAAISEVARTQADRRARTLLLRCLDRVQRRAFRQQGAFDLVASSGRRYRLKEGRQGNVFRLDSQGREVECLCGHPREAVPVADTLLAQKLWLETDETAFRRVANRHWGSAP